MLSQKNLRVVKTSFDYYFKSIKMNRAKITLLLLFFIIMAVLQGYQLGVGDLTTYIPFVLHEYDKTLFDNDLLMETISSHPVFIWKFLSYFLHGFELELLFQVLFYFQVTVIAISVWLFYRHFFGNNFGWLIVLLMLVVSKKTPAMGGFGLNSYQYFHPGALAFGATLFIYLLLDRGYWIIGGILTGLVFLFHPITAIYASLFFTIKLILEYRDVSYRKLVPGVLLLILVSAPSWFPYFRHLIEPAGSDFNLALWFELVKMRMGRAFFI